MSAEKSPPPTSTAGRRAAPAAPPAPLTPLTGWASLALSGLIYSVFPTAGANRLALWHFWLHNIGLVIFIIGLTAIVSGHFSVPILGFALAGAGMVIVAVILLLINVFRNVRPTR